MPVDDGDPPALPYPGQHRGEPAVLRRVLKQLAGIVLVVTAGDCGAVPDIRNPGPELPTYPENVDTLPAGTAYVELSAGYLGRDRGEPGRYNTPFLLHYGVIENVELRLYDNGFTWYESHQGYRGFEPLSFGSLIHIMDEKPAYFLPSIAFEPIVTTNLLGNANTTGGVQPILMLTFQNTLPEDIQFNYTFGALRVRNGLGRDDWQFQFQWALQRQAFFEDLQLFVHGTYNTMTGTSPDAAAAQTTFMVGQSVIGGGFIYTLNERLALFGQASGGLNADTPAMVSWTGFSVAF